MGWCHEKDEHGEHEGYIVGLVELEPGSRAYRELTYHQDRARIGNTPLRLVQVGCDCGWRSPRIAAPSGAYWAPYIVVADQAFEENCRALWCEHVDREILAGRRSVG